jgi:hypothetical protein
MSYEANFLTKEYRKKLRQLKDAPAEKLPQLAVKYSPFISLPVSCIALICVAMKYPTALETWSALALLSGGLFLGLVAAIFFPKPYLAFLSVLLFDWCTLFKLRK